MGGRSGRRELNDPGVARDAGGYRSLAWLLPFLLIGASGLLGHWIHRNVPGDFRADRKGPPPPTLMGTMSRNPAFAFGFRNILADMVWLEAVQVAGNPYLTSGDYDRFAELTDTVLRFDPRFVVPYLFGGMVLGDSRDHAPEALRILERGSGNFPAEWRFPFYVGYIQYFSLGNPVEGGMALLRASRIPGSPAHFPLLASRMLSEGNRPETALAFLGEMVIHEKDPLRRKSLEERIRRVEVERDLRFLEAAIAEYRAKIGSAPGDLEALVRAGILGRIPTEPYGGKYHLAPDGQVRSDRAPGGRLRVLRNR